MPITLEHIFSAPFLRSVLLRKNLLKNYAPKIRSAAVNIYCKFLFGNACVSYGNACVLFGNAYQAASPSLTAFGAESRPRSSPPTTLKLAFLYGNAFFAVDINGCTLFMRKLCSALQKSVRLRQRFLLRSAKHAHERLNTSSPLHFLGRFCYAKTYLRITLRRYVQQPLISTANSSSVTLVSSSVTLTKLRARLSHPTEQRADLAASHPPPLI